MPRQHHQGLQRVKAFLGDFHVGQFTTMSICLIDLED